MNICSLTDGETVAQRVDAFFEVRPRAMALPGGTDTNGTVEGTNSTNSAIVVDNEVLGPPFFGEPVCRVTNAV